MSQALTSPKRLVAQAFPGQARRFSSGSLVATNTATRRGRHGIDKPGIRQYHKIVWNVAPKFDDAA